jgi:hypothetical protein
VTTARIRTQDSILRKGTEGTANENTPGKQLTINRRNVLLGTTSIAAAAAISAPPDSFMSTAAAQNAPPQGSGPKRDHGCIAAT